MSNLTTKYLIIGNSAGGIGGVTGIREGDGNGAIIMVSQEPYPAYSRPLIAECLADGCSLDRMLYRPSDFYDKNAVKVLFNPAIKLDTKARIIQLKDGSIIGYEKLLLATGGIPINPRTPGMDKKGVFNFITLDDAKDIANYLSGTSIRHAVVIGGGLIGVSVSEALAKRGVPVSVVELKDYILNTILDAEGGALASKAVAKAGVALITGRTVSEINGDGEGRVMGVTLDDKRYIPCELVVMAIGVRPNVALAQGTDIKVNRGILVNREMETSVPGVYSCGDAAEAYDFIYGDPRLSPIWPNANVGGRVAGLNMAGVKTEYPGGTAMNSLKYFGLDMVTAGLTSPADGSYEVVKGITPNAYRKLILKDGRIVGMVFAGNIEKAGIVYNFMRDRVNVNVFKKELTAEELNIAALPKDIWQSKVRVPA